MGAGVADHFGAEVDADELHLWEGSGVVARGEAVAAAYVEDAARAQAGAFGAHGFDFEIAEVGFAEGGAAVGAELAGAVVPEGADVRQGVRGGCSHLLW